MSRIEKGLKAAVREWIDTLPLVHPLDSIVKNVSETKVWYKLDSSTALLTYCGNVIKAVYVGNTLSAISFYGYSKIPLISPTNDFLSRLLEIQPSSKATTIQAFNEYVQLESETTLAYTLLKFESGIINRGAINSGWSIVSFNCTESKRHGTVLTQNDQGNVPLPCFFVNGKCRYVVYYLNYSGSNVVDVLNFETLNVELTLNSVEGFKTFHADTLKQYQHDRQLNPHLSPTDKPNAVIDESTIIKSINFVQVVETVGAYTMCALDDKGVIWGLVAPAVGVKPYWERLPEPNEDRQSEEVQQALRKGFLNWLRTLHSTNTTQLHGVWYLTIQSTVMVDCQLGGERFVIEGVYLNGRGVDNRVTTFNNTLSFIPEGYCRIRALVNNTPIWIDSLDGFRTFLAGVQDRIFAN